MVKNLPTNAGKHKRFRFDPCIKKICCKRKRQPTPVFSPGESHGQSSLAGYSPRGHKKSDKTEATYTHLSTTKNFLIFSIISLQYFMKTSPPLLTLFNYISRDNYIQSWAFQVLRNLPANARDTGDMGSVPGLVIFPGVGNGNPLQSSCLGNSMDRGAWQTTVYGVAKTQA